MSLKQVRSASADSTAIYTADSPQPAVDGQRLTYTCPQQEIETWVEALKFYDNNEFDEALKSFDRVADTSKILFNMGVINATLGQHEQAVRTPVPCSLGPPLASVLTLGIG